HQKKGEIMNFLSLIFACLFLVSCASKEKNSESKINTLEVEEKIIEGKTTQAQILQNFGTPDVVEKTELGDMWGFHRSSYEDSGVDAGMAASVFGYFSSLPYTWVGGSKSQAGSVSKTLVIHFNKNRVVSSYNFR